MIIYRIEKDDLGLYRKQFKSLISEDRFREMFRKHNEDGCHPSRVNSQSSSFDYEELTVGISFEEKLSKAYYLSLKIAYIPEPDGRLLKLRDLPYSDDFIDKVFGWCDGLECNYYHKMMSGMCSISASINFSLEEAEKDVDDTIELFESVLKEIENK